MQLQLTAAGRRKTTELMPLVVDRLNTALGDFSKDEFEQFMRLLKKFIASLREMEQVARRRHENRRLHRAGCPARRLRGAAA